MINTDQAGLQHSEGKMYPTTQSTFLVLRLPLGHSQDDMPATRREAGEHQGAVQGHLNQPPGDGHEHPGTHGMCHLLQTRSFFDKSEVKGHPGDGVEALQEDDSLHQEAGRLD